MCALRIQDRTCVLRPGSDIWRQGPRFPSSILAGRPSSPRCPEVPPRSPVLLPGPSSCLAAGQQVSPLDSEWVRWDRVHDPVLPVAPFQTSSITEGWQRGRLWMRGTGAAGSWNRWAQGEAVSASSAWTHTVRKEPDGPRCPAVSLQGDPTWPRRRSLDFPPTRDWTGLLPLPRLYLVFLLGPLALPQPLGRGVRVTSQPPRGRLPVPGVSTRA